MNTTEDFPTEDVLSTITGHLMGKIDGVYLVLNWMTGESVYTHQLPRISREAQPVILKLHPQLADAIREAEQVTPTNWQEWRDKWIARYGTTLAVPKLDENTHERIDPLSELAEMVPPGRIVVVSP